MRVFSVVDIGFDLRAFLSLFILIFSFFAFKAGFNPVVSLLGSLHKEARARSGSRQLLSPVVAVYPTHELDPVSGEDDAPLSSEEPEEGPVILDLNYSSEGVFNSAHASLKFSLMQQEISRVAQTPLRFFFSDGEKRINWVWDSKHLEDLMTTLTQEDRLLVVLEEQDLDAALIPLSRSVGRKSKIEFNGRSFMGDDRVLDQEKLKEAIRDALSARFRRKPPKEEFNLASFVQYLPGSDGSLARKYMEVDISQQKLYLWEGGKLVGTHIVSTGANGWTPLGVHRILNKARNPWAQIAQVYCPFWMAYYYSPRLGVYMGFHELPYWTGPNGEHLRRPADRLGTPVTGGCIQLNVGVAEKVYHWADVGILVLIHE